ncbi:hypothetical protein F5I97DRAFT_1929723 [Phlebopus sp. FC_14]|nr:hypothetical protein F5I97DRAFT_1929723 [Phlebopus sp. FC_14]
MASRAASPVPPFPTSSKQPTPIQPNAHPYAIKTTSSALLSRSNSSPHTIHPPKHHYVPPSPTRQRHRHSSSLSLVEGVSVNEVTHPAPLPTPPSFSASPTRPSFPVSKVNTPRRMRADTLPTGSTTPMVGTTNNTILDGDLPSNPKQWSTEQSATYLAASLRKSGDLDAQSIDEVLDCVRGRGLTGRDLLRLTDVDLASTPLSDAQKARLLQNARSLRADVLRGRIWADAPNSSEPSNHSKDVFTRSIRSVQSSPFHNDLYRTSISSVDLLLPRSSPFDAELLPSPTSSLHHRSEEASAQRYRDLAGIRARRRGKVKGLVEAWEREREGRRGSVSGSSECSMSEGSVAGSDAESESEANQGAEQEQEQLPLPVESTPPAADDSVADSTVILSSPPPDNSVTVDDEEEELSIEELLASSASFQGARAWEADFALGETVKRVPVETATSDAILESTGSRKRISTVEQGNDSRPNGTADGTGSRGRNNRTQKRVVTAIFTGATSSQAVERSDETPATGHAVNTFLPSSDGAANGVDIAESSQVPSVPLGTEQHADEVDDIVRALKASIESTRAQLEAFRVRLEAVERDIARHDAEQLAYPNTTSLRDDVDGQTNLPTENVSPIHEMPPKPATEDIFAFKFNVRDMARSVLATAIGWVYPYSHPGIHPRPRDACPSRSREGSRSPARRRPALPAFRISCVIFFSFALCAAVLRRAGFGRWVRGT